MVLRFPVRNPSAPAAEKRPPSYNHGMAKSGNWGFKANLAILWRLASTEVLDAVDWRGAWRVEVMGWDT